MFYLADFKKEQKQLNEAEKEKQKIKALGGLAGLGIVYSPPFQNTLQKSIKKPLNRARATVRQNPEVQKDILKYFLRTKDELKNKKTIDDTQLEGRLKNIFRKRTINDPDYTDDYFGRSEKAKLNTLFKKVGIPAINDPSKDVGKYFNSANLKNDSLKREYLNKYNSIKNHSDIKDEIQRNKQLEILKKRYEKKGLDLKPKMSASKSKSYKIIKGNLLKAITNPIALGLGTGFLINAATDILGNRRRNQVAKNKNLEIKKDKNENLKAGLKTVAGLGLLGYASISGKNKLVKSFLRKNKNGTTTKVKSHVRLLGGGK